MQRTSTSPSTRPVAVASAAPAGGRLALSLLLAINLFNYIDRFVLAASLTSVGKEFFADGDPYEKTKKGLLATAFLVTFILAAPIFGWFADRMSRWTLIAIGVVLWSVASAASGLATSYSMLFVTRIFVGVGEAVYGPAAPTLLSDYFPIQRRGRVMAVFYVAIPVGSALGYALGGIASQYWTWRWGFYVVAPPGILLGALCMLFRDPRFPGKATTAALTATDPSPTPVIADLASAPPPAAASGKPDYWSLLRNRSYVLNTLGMTALTFAMGGVAWWMPEYIVRQQGPGSSEAEVGLTFGALTAVAGLLSIVVGGWISDRLRDRVRGAYFMVSAIGMFVALPLFLLVLWAQNSTLMYALIFLTECCLFLNTGPTNTILANVTHPSVRATGFAINILVIHLLGDVFSPFLIGAITDANHGNLKIGFQAVSVAVFIGGIFWLLGRKHLEADITRAECNSPPTTN